MTLKETTNTVVTYRTSDQVAMLGLGLVLAAGILFLGRSRVDADADGVRVRNIVVHHRLPWQAVRAVRFERKSAWASLLLENGDEVSLLAVQAVDREHAVRRRRGAAGAARGGAGERPGAAAAAVPDPGMTGPTVTL